MLRATLRSLLAHTFRLLLSGLAIVLGVGFVVGTLIFTDTLNKTFNDLFTQTTTDVVLSPKSDVTSDIAGALPTLPASLVPTVSAVSGVQKANGAILVDGVSVIGKDGKVVGTAGPPQYGSNWSDDQELTPYRLIEGAGPTQPGQIAVDSVAADKGGYAVGDSVALVTPLGNRTAKLVGIFRFGTSGNLAGATITAFDTKTAQRLLLGGANAFTEIDAVAAAGVTQPQLAANITAVVPANVKVQTGQQAADEAAKQIDSALSFVNIFLLVFAGIALFVGVFIIFNTFAMLVGQRSQELALLRAVGATRRQVIRSVVTEAAIVGLVGSILGVIVGVVVAIGLQALFKAIGADIPTDGLVLAPRTVIVGLIVGLVVTVVAALSPAIRASRIPPMAALRADYTPTRSSMTWRIVTGSVVMIAGVATMVSGVATGAAKGSALVGFGTVATLVGAILLSPLVSGPMVGALGWVYPRWFGTVGRLALDNARRQPRRTAATASALMIGLALVSALTIFATSTSASVNAAINRIVGAEFILVNQAQRAFPTSVAQTAAQVPGVAAVSAIKQVPAKVNGQGTFLTAIDPETIGQMINLTYESGSAADIKQGTVAVDANSASDQSLTIGDRVNVTLPTGPVTLTISAVYAAAGGITGFVTNVDTLTAAGLNTGDTVVYAKAEPDADLAAVQGDLETALTGYPTVQVQSQAQFKQSFQNNVNQLLAVMVLLLSLAILIAILGIVNTLVLSVIERTREIGLLRAVGALRKQVRRMVVLESVVIALFGAVLGLILGIGFAAALQRTLADQGIDQLSIPWISLALFTVLAAIVGALAALWPAFRAGRLDVLRAVTTE